MLSISDIKKYYSESLVEFPKSYLREYLQVKILDIIFNSRYSQKLCFIGGTALRLIYNNKRFSEDLDFDNFGLSFDDFENLTKLVKKGLELEGLEVEIRNISKGAYHCHIKLPNILFENGMASMPNEKLLILLDTIPQEYSFTPNKVILKKFETLVQLNTVSKELLLAQKLFTILNRKTSKGRDYFDILFLLSENILPERAYLKQKLENFDLKIIKAKILDFTSRLDFNQLSKDVQPFLFNPDDTRVSHFVEYFKSVEW